MDAERPGALRAGSTSADRLRAAGLRSTRQRTAMLDALDARPGHHRADEIVGLLLERGTPLSRSTVFKVLDDLAGASLVARVELVPGAARYEGVGPERHHHFVCRVCSEIIDVPVVDHAGEAGSIERSLVGATEALGHRVDEVEVVGRGTCRVCCELGTSLRAVRKTER